MMMDLMRSVRTGEEFQNSLRFLFFILKIINRLHHKFLLCVVQIAKKYDKIKFTDTIFRLISS